MEIKKTCSKCGKRKTLSDDPNVSKFDMTSRLYNGKVYKYFRADCKTCRKKETKKRNKKNRFKIQEYNREYYKEHLAYFRQYYRNKKEKLNHVE